MQDYTKGLYACDIRIRIFWFKNCACEVKECDGEEGSVFRQERDGFCEEGGED